MKEIIKIVNVSKSFKNNVIFNNINLSIKKGEIVGLFGFNGSGKSVLFKLISGIYRADSGEIFVNDKKVGIDIDFPDNLGISVDSPGFIDVASGFKNLKYLADIKNIITYDDIKNIMLKVGLDPSNKTLVKNYSLGMKQKLALAQAIMEDQEIILLDEPFNALDSVSYEKLINIIYELKENNKTIILTSHNNPDMYKLCDNIYEISNKKVVHLHPKSNL